MTARAALSPYDYDHSAIEEAGGDPANLAVIKPVVDHCYRVPGKHFLGVNREIEIPMCDRPLALGGVEGRFHACLCNYIIRPASSIM